MSNNTRRKSRQWAFTIPAFSNATIDRLLNLPLDDVTYLTFAICDDDTSNRYIQGLLKTTRRCSVCVPKRMIGNAIFSVVTCPKDILMDIHLTKSFVEFGETPFENHHGEIASLKCAIDMGEHSVENLMQAYPHICAQYIRHVLRYIHDVTSTKTETSKTETSEVIPQIVSLCA